MKWKRDSRVLQSKESKRYWTTIQSEETKIRFNTHNRFDKHVISFGKNI